MSNSSGKSRALADNLLYQYFDAEISENYCIGMSGVAGEGAEPRSTDERNINLFTVFPNPSNGKINAVIDYENIVCKSSLKIVCYNSQGKEVTQSKLGVNQEVTTLNIKNAASGIYIVVLYCGEDIINTQKIVIR